MTWSLTFTFTLCVCVGGRRWSFLQKWLHLHSFLFQQLLRHNILQRNWTIPLLAWKLLKRSTFTQTNSELPPFHVLTCISNTSCCCFYLGIVPRAHVLKKSALLLHLPHAIVVRLLVRKTAVVISIPETADPFCVWAVTILVGRIFHPGRSHGCCPVRATEGSLLPCGRYLLAALTGNKEGSIALIMIYNGKK